MPTYIALIGRAGTGKSFFINVVCGEEVAPVGEPGTVVCTRTISQYTTTLPDGEELVFVDTPGYRDNRTDPGTEILVPWRSCVLSMLVNYSKEHQIRFQIVMLFHVCNDTSMEADLEGDSAHIEALLRYSDSLCRIVTHCDAIPPGGLAPEGPKLFDALRFYGYARKKAKTCYLFHSGKTRGVWYQPPSGVLQSVLNRRPKKTARVGPPDEAAETIRRLEEQLLTMTEDRDNLFARCQQLVAERDQLQEQLNQKTTASSTMSECPGPRDAHAGRTGPKDIPSTYPEPGANHPQLTATSEESSSSYPPPSGPEDPPSISPSSTSSERQKQILESFDACAQEMQNIASVLDDELQRFLAELKTIEAGLYPANMEYKDATSEYQVMLDELKKLGTTEHPRVLADKQALLERERELENELTDLNNKESRSRSGAARAFPKTKKRLEDSLGDVRARLGSTCTRLAALEREHEEGRGELLEQVDEINRLRLVLEAWVGFNAVQVGLNYAEWPTTWIQGKRSQLENPFAGLRQRLISEWDAESPSKAFISLATQGSSPDQDTVVDWRGIALSWHRHYTLLKDIMGILDAFRSVPDAEAVKKASEVVEESYRRPLLVKRWPAPEVTPLGGR